MRSVLWLAGLLWLGTVLTLLVWQKQSTTTIFDPKLVMADHFHYLNAAMAKHTKEDTVTAIHIVSEDCFCNLSSRKHRNEVWRLSQAKGINNVAITLESLPNESASFIPAAPAVLIYHGKNLTYAGPYSSGVFCSSGNGLVEPWLTSLEQLQLLYETGFSPVVPSDAQGCYCRNNLYIT